ncbi:aspartate 1-decarboxylase [Candidatus Nitrosoglobus terrae]|uniref:Aspartate 1-decarboxylase n=1 Tax=Candidatus Nitrosoglobus terrae TaxID=1630141 RepID=A0A1Q2SL17_9GAMM|nr:aspartate 1-decarboxylase [Candidatus Nitrosoglobus terrae]BAW79841.1 aspartate 1-decarboxylase [Candidatus Nitrosoglobus terrae]
MYLTLLKSKLHRARVTHAELEYEGSCAIDGSLLDVARIQEYEQIHIYNLNNGERFVTYAIRAECGSSIVSVNGAAARKACPNDRLIICVYAMFDHSKVGSFKPYLVYLNSQNSITHTQNIPS